MKTPLCVNTVYLRVGMVLVMCNSCISYGYPGSDLLRKNLSDYVLLR